MSTSKSDSSESPTPSEVPSGARHLTLPYDAVTIRRNGIEFRSAKSINTWTEMSIDLESPWESSKLECRGIVVACSGNRHAGYIVSLLFTDLTPQAQQKLNAISFSQLG